LSSNLTPLIGQNRKYDARRPRDASPVVRPEFHQFRIFDRSLTGIALITNIFNASEHTTWTIRNEEGDTWRKALRAERPEPKSARTRERLAGLGAKSDE
jgi:hypothetical protein